jgi:hypothetical protein
VEWFVILAVCRLLLLLFVVVWVLVLVLVREATQVHRVYSLFDDRSLDCSRSKAQKVYPGDVFPKKKLQITVRKR